MVGKKVNSTGRILQLYATQSKSPAGVRFEETMGGLQKYYQILSDGQAAKGRNVKNK